MFSRQEASAIRQKFWISFGKYISPVPSSSGEKQRWINYKTGVKPVSFKMDATATHAYIAIEILHKDVFVSEKYFNQFKALNKQLEKLLNEKWDWQLNTIDDNGKNISRIYTALKKVNVFNENDWPAIISFLKTRIIALDRFWNEYRDAFEIIE